MELVKMRAGGGWSFSHPSWLMGWWHAGLCRREKRGPRGGKKAEE